jgi:hypothetical protein
MILNSKLCYHIFEESISDYHVADDIDQTIRNPYADGDIRQLLYRKNWMDTVQWHLEDEIRDPAIDPAYALTLKRRIDQSNQQRTDLVELIDHIILQDNTGVRPAPDAALNTETPAWANDRLSILALKIYHMQAETRRVDADETHRKSCGQKLAVLEEQREDLGRAIDTLLLDIGAGRKIMKLYKQMKMYNDPAFNPVLYKKS